MKLKEIQEIINESMEINNKLLVAVKDANKQISNCQKEFLNILQQQNTCSTLKRYTEQKLSKEQISDLIHLFEFKQIKLKGYNTKILKLLQERRRHKLLVSYVHRVQKEKGFFYSVYWYNLNNKNKQYTLKTDILNFKKGQIIIDN